jgi:hypothetical protein
MRDHSERIHRVGGCLDHEAHRAQVVNAGGCVDNSAFTAKLSSSLMYNFGVGPRFAFVSASSRHTK